jgi:hypothetical protein
VAESIWRYPLKSAQGETVTRAFFGLDGPAQADEALSGWLGERVQLSSEVPLQARLHRLWPKEPGMIPEWADRAGAGQEEITEIAGAVPGGRFVDFGAIHLVTTQRTRRAKGWRRARRCPAAAAQPCPFARQGTSPR